MYFLKTIKIISLAGIILASLLSPALVLADEDDSSRSILGGPLVTCTENCTFCDLLETANNVVNFIIELSFLIAFIVVIVLGFQLMFSGGNASRYASAKGALYRVLIGIAIIMVSWVFVNQLLNILAGEGFESNITKWHTLECSIDRPSFDSPPRDPVSTSPSPFPEETPTERPSSPPSGSVKASSITHSNNSAVVEKNKDLAASIIDPSLFRDFGTCPPEEVNNAKLNFEQLKEGEKLTVCSPSCDCSTKNITANPNILKIIKYLNDLEYNFKVSSIATGPHSSVSDHYTGNAVDIIPRSATITECLNIRNAIIDSPYGNSVRFMYEPNYCASSGVKHLHVGFYNYSQ